jgi:hypothetical protein
MDNLWQSVDTDVSLDEIASPRKINDEKCVISINETISTEINREDLQFSQ